MSYEPEDLKEQAGVALSASSPGASKATSSASRSSSRSAARETGAWRGEIIHGAPEDSTLHTAGYDRGREGGGDGMANKDYQQPGGLKEPGAGRDV